MLAEVSRTDSTTRADDGRGWRPDLVYSSLLLAAAVAAVVIVGGQAGFVAENAGWGTVGFFLVFGLFTITTGFPHPVFGHVSLYRFLGGPVPLHAIDLGTGLRLILLVAGMLVIMQYALMRYRLEKLVDERSEALRVQAREFERQATHDTLTRLKRINDSHSHAIGDEVLVRVGQTLRDGCRKTDFVARYGGEEFLLLFPGTAADGALEVCRDLRLAVENADMHLYRAKRQGRNRVVSI